MGSQEVISSSNSMQISWSLFQKQRLTEQLNKCCPFVYVISHCGWLILHSCIQIAIQIALMANNGALWWVGAGIWAGVYFICIALVTLLAGISFISDFKSSSSLTKFFLLFLSSSEKLFAFYCILHIAYNWNFSSNRCLSNCQHNWNR